MFKTKLNKIIEEFFATGGNHSLDKYVESKHKFLELIKDDELFLDTDDESFIFSRDIIRFIDADTIYAKTTDSKKAYNHIEPFLKRMMELDSNDWHYDALKLLISSVHFSEDVEQATKLAYKADERIVGFQIVRLTDNLEGALACNMCSRILNAKYFGDDDEKIDLSKQFDSWLDRLGHLVVTNKDSEYLEMIWHITQIRQRIFYNDDTDIFTLCDDLVPQYDKKIGQMIQNEVKFYMAAGAFEKGDCR